MRTDFSFIRPFSGGSIPQDKNILSSESRRYSAQCTHITASQRFPSSQVRSLNSGRCPMDRAETILMGLPLACDRKDLAEAHHARPGQHDCIVTHPGPMPAKVHGSVRCPWNTRSRLPTARLGEVTLPSQDRWKPWARLRRLDFQAGVNSESVALRS